MKGPFGMLLIGGSIILLIGLFTGKIVFPGMENTPQPSPVENIIRNTTNPAGQYQVGGPNDKGPPVNGKCPQGFFNITVGGVNHCIKPIYN
jgi:hypothetical protein